MPNRHPIPSMETGEDAKANACGILFARGAHHRGLRAAWQPMFHSGSLQGFHGIMLAAADKLNAILAESAVDGRPVDIWRRLGDFTMQISGTTAFGVDIPAQDVAADDGASSAMVKSAKDFFDAAGQIEGIYALLQVMFPPLVPVVQQLATALPTPSYAAGLRGRHAVQAKVTALLQEHRKRSERGLLVAEGMKQVKTLFSSLFFFLALLVSLFGALFDELTYFVQQFLTATSRIVAEELRRKIFFLSSFLCLSIQFFSFHYSVRS